MSGLRIAAVQFRGVARDGSAGLDRLEELAEIAAPVADLVVMPELAATAYGYPDAAAAARVAEDSHGPTFTRLSRLAKQHGCWMVVGFVERARDSLYNSAMILDPQGCLHDVYRKTLLYEADGTWAAPGDGSYRSFEVKGRRVGVGICMDLNDDPFIAWLQSAAIDVLAFPTNWVYEPTLDTWTYWCLRLLDTPLVLVAANTWGVEGGVRYTGRSLILSSDRRVLAAGPEQGDGVLSATVLATAGRASRTSGS